MKYTIIIILAFIPLCSFSPVNDYPKIFGNNFNDALEVCKEHHNNFLKIADEHELPVKELKAIVFPELIRYNLLKDLMETQALIWLYVDGGSKAADFSIGHFQMKPSFAEKIEQIVAEGDPSSWTANYLTLCSYNNLNEKQVRKKRIERLSDIEWQIKYLSCFYEIASRKLSPDLDQKEKIKMLATMYNSGLDKSEEELKKWMNKKSFPYGPKVKPNTQQNYADIAAYFYQNY